jgi:tRNA threonylcarbamoyl adenosine modification protein YeaZ
MKILTLEFSSSQRSVAITGPGDFAISEIIDTGKSAPLTVIEAALREAKLEREQIDCMVVGLGPGSYTGIRAAISLAQGWQLACGIKLMGISSAECLAAQAVQDGIRGRVSVVIDAQREEFYLATYELADESHREIEPLKIVTMAELHRWADAGETLIGPEVTHWFASGRIVFPRAATLGSLASNRSDFIPGEKLEPIYLRETQFVKAPPSRIIS